MESLPQRDDAIYKEIESFEEYELTQCVAYEMAIRNEANLSMIDDVVEYYLKIKDNPNVDLSDENSNEYLELSYSFNDITIIPFIAKEIHYNGLDDLTYFNDFYENLGCYEDNRINKIIYSIINDVFLLGSHHLMRGLFNDSIRVISNDLLGKTFLEKRAYRNGYYVYTEMNENSEYCHIPLNNNDENCEATKEVSSLKDWKIHIENGLEEMLESSSRVVENFKRPKLKLEYNFESIPSKIELDMKKPLNELIAYITHIKEDLEKNKDILKAPIELLGEELHKTNETPKQKAKRWADMFFVYDYVTKRLLEIESYNNKAKQDYEEELSKIKSNPDLTKKEKAIQKSVANSEYLENLIDTKITDIFSEDELTKQLNLKKDSISNMYYVMKPYIEERKYKELITGVSE